MREGHTNLGSSATPKKYRKRNVDRLVGWVLRV